MRKVDLLSELEPIVRSETGRRGRPLAHPVHGQHGRLLEGRGEEGARGMALMVLGEEEPPPPVEGGDVRLERLREQELLKQLLPEPQRNRHGKGRESSRGEGQIRLEKTLELEKRLVIEDDVIHLGEAAPGRSQAILDGAAREARVVFPSGEALLLGGGHDAPVVDERSRAVVIEGRDTEDAQARRPQKRV